MPTTYQPLVDDVANHAEPRVTLSLTEIEAILGPPLPETMHVDGWQRKSAEFAPVWRLNALGWRARLDRRNRCVHVTRDAEE